MQELLFGPLLLTWGPQIIHYVRQYPWRVFAAILVVVLLMDLMFRKRSQGSGGDGGDFGGLGFEATAIAAAAIDAAWSISSALALA